MPFLVHQSQLKRLLNAFWFIVKCKYKVEYIIYIAETTLQKAF